MRHQVGVGGAWSVKDWRVLSSRPGVDTRNLEVPEHLQCNDKVPEPQLPPGSAISCPAFAFMQLGQAPAMSPEPERDQVIKKKVHNYLFVSPRRTLAALGILTCPQECVRVRVRERCVSSDRMVTYPWCVLA